MDQVQFSQMGVAGLQGRGHDVTVDLLEFTARKSVRTPKEQHVVEFGGFSCS